MKVVLIYILLITLNFIQNHFPNAEAKTLPTINDWNSSLETNIAGFHIPFQLLWGLLFCVKIQLSFSFHLYRLQSLINESWYTYVAHWEQDISYWSELKHLRKNRRKRQTIQVWSWAHLTYPNINMIRKCSR